MSFSSGVRDELSRRLPTARHCRIAEIAAILGMCGTITEDENGKLGFRIRTEQAAVARKFFTLLRDTWEIRPEIGVSRGGFGRKKRSLFVMVRDHDKAFGVLKAVRMIGPDGEPGEDFATVRRLLLRSDCCRRSYLRGAFLASGSISDPEKFYHLEFVCQEEERARQLCEIIATFDLEAKTVVRKNHYVVYIKEGSQIVELLGLMGADQALMDLENIRIVKEMRNSVNRQVNCEAANIRKTVSAAARQLEDIAYIRDSRGLDYLPGPLREIAALRLSAPDAALKDLGQMLDKPVGKSGVNHRLRRISEIAEELRAECREETDGKQRDDD